DRFHLQARLCGGAVGPVDHRPHRHGGESCGRPALRSHQSANPGALKMAAVSEPATAARPVSGLREFWHYFSVNRGAVLGLVVFGLLLVLAIFAPLVAPHL